MNRVVALILVSTVTACMRDDYARAGEVGLGTKALSARTDSYGDRLPSDALFRFGTHRLTHVAEVNSVLFCSGSRNLVVTTEHPDGGITARTWNTGTGKLLKDSLCTDGVVLGPAVRSIDGNALVPARRRRGNAVFWNLASDSYEPIPIKESDDDKAYSVVVSGDRKLLARCADQVTLFSFPHCAPISELHPSSNGVHSLVFSPDGNQVAACVNKKRRVQVWAVHNGKSLFSFDEPSGFVQLAFSPIGETLAACTGNGRVLVWNTASGQELWRSSIKPAYACLTFSSGDNKLVAAGLHIDFLEPQTGRCVQHFGSFATSVSHVDLSSDGGIIAATFKGTHRIRLWDHGTGTELMPVRGHNGAVSSLCFSTDGRTLASSGFDGSICLWDLGTGQQASHFEPKTAGVSFAAFAHENSVLVIKDGRGNVYSCPVRAGGPEKLVGRCDPENSIAITGASDLLSSAWEQGAIHVRDVTSGKEVVALPLPSKPGPISTIAIGAGKVLISASSAEGKLVWITRSEGKQPVRISLPSDVEPMAFGFDGTSFAASPGYASIKIWSMNPCRITCSLNNINAIDSAVFSPDNRLSAVAGREGLIRVWEIASAKPLCEFIGHQQWPSFLKFSEDGRMLASAGEDSVVYVWDMTGFGVMYKPSPLSATQMALLWDALTDGDPSTAWRALWRLVACGDAAISLLQDSFKCAGQADESSIKRLITELDSDQFMRRSHAMRELLSLGDCVEASVQRALDESRTPESSRRLREIIRRLPGEHLRKYRAIALLEHLGSSRAIEFLRKLQRSSVELTLRHEAATALSRLPKLRDAGTNEVHSQSK